MSSNRHALVTGSSSGIGQAIAQLLLDAGWQVTGWDIAPPRITSAAFVSQEVDLTACQATDAALSQLTTHCVPDAVVHAAGVMRSAHLGSLHDPDSTFMWQLHTQAAMRLANHVLPLMAACGHGRFVLIGSRVADGLAGRSQYAATKAALVALARSWAAEVVHRGVTVNVVSPAATQTSMLEDPARQSSAPRLPPIGRLIQPEEIAGLVHYLLSPLAGAITGQDIRICGGASLSQ